MTAAGFKTLSLAIYISLSHVVQIRRLSSLRVARLFRRLVQVRDEIRSILRTLQTRKDHLGAGDVLFRVFQVYEQRVLCPLDAFALISIRVAEAWGLSCGASYQSMKVRPCLMFAPGLYRVALHAALFEHGLALLRITVYQSFCTHCSLVLFKLNV